MIAVGNALGHPTGLPDISDVFQRRGNDEAESNRGLARPLKEGEPLLSLRRGPIENSHATRARPEALQGTC